MTFRIVYDEMTGAIVSCSQGTADTAVPAGCQVLFSAAFRHPDWFYVDTATKTFKERPLPTQSAAPRALTPVEFKLGMLEMGVTPQQITDFIAAISDDTERMRAEIYWTSTLTFERDNPLVALIATGFGKSSAEIDAAWEAATAVNAG